MDPATLPYRDCAGVMLINAEGLIFTGERLDTAGAWQMPQGGIDEGESPQAAAFRELEEETGVSRSAVELIAESPNWLTYDLPPHLLGKSWGGKYRGQRQKWFLMRLTDADSCIDIDTAHPEFSRWRWCDKTALINDIVAFKKPLYAQILDSFKSNF